MVWSVLLAAEMAVVAVVAVEPLLVSLLFLSLPQAASTVPPATARPDSFMNRRRLNPPSRTSALASAGVSASSTSSRMRESRHFGMTSRCSWSRSRNWRRSSSLLISMVSSSPVSAARQPTGNLAGSRNPSFVSNDGMNILSSSVFPSTKPRAMACCASTGMTDATAL